MEKNKVNISFLWLEGIFMRKKKKNTKVEIPPLRWLTTIIYLRRLLFDGVSFDCNHTLMCINVSKFFFRAPYEFCSESPLVVSP